MKRFSLLLFLAWYSLTISSQNPTLKETQEWIKQKFDIYGNIEYIIDENFAWKNDKVSYTVNFYEEDVLTLITNYHRGLRNTLDYTVYKIPLKNMKSIYYEKQDDFVSIFIGLRDDFRIDNFIKEFQHKNLKSSEDIQLELLTDNILRFEIRFNSSFIENNMPERFKKAFDHLIEFYEGQVVKEVF